MHNRETAAETKSMQSNASGILVIPPSPRRTAILIGNPHFIDIVPNSKAVHNASGAAAGVVLSYTVPAGATALFTGGSVFSTAVAGVITSLQWIQSGGPTVTLTTVTTSGTYNVPLQLNAGDTIQWNVTTTQAASTSDYTLSVTQSAGQHGTTLVSYGAGRTAGQGIPISQTVSYLFLTATEIGKAINESIILEDSAGQQVTYTWTEWLYAA